MVNLFKKFATSFSTVHIVQRWVLEFERGRTTDKRRIWNLVVAQKLQQHMIIEQLHNVANEESSLTKRVIADTIGISDERLLHISDEEILTIRQKLK